MRLLCFSCGKSVTNELPNDTILRAIATCPECLLKDTDDALQQHVAELQLEVDSKISAWEIMKNTADRYKQQMDEWERKSKNNGLAAAIAVERMTELQAENLDYAADLKAANELVDDLGDFLLCVNEPHDTSCAHYRNENKSCDCEYDNLVKRFAEHRSRVEGMR